jgi:hypothetical protein
MAIQPDPEKIPRFPALGWDRRLRVTRLAVRPPVTLSSSDERSDHAASLRERIVTCVGQCVDGFGGQIAEQRVIDLVQAGSAAQICHGKARGVVVARVPDMG